MSQLKKKNAVNRKIRFFLNIDLEKKLKTIKARAVFV